VTNPHAAGPAAHYPSGILGSAHPGTVEDCPNLLCVQARETAGAPDSTLRGRIAAALSGAGAFCGQCGFEPGDRGCPDCERCWDAYADALLPLLTAERETVGREEFPGPFQVWPLTRVLADVAVGSGDWTWDEEWADPDARHAATGYLDTLEQQIRENGITMPVLIGNDGRLWDGHHRLRIAVRLGIPYVPVEVVPPGPTTNRADATGEQA
jgi:hypothetical protein